MSGVTDFHTHAFPDDLAGRAIKITEETIRGDEKAVLDGTVGGLLKSMDQAGIERSVICPIATAPKQFVPILNWALSIRSDRIVPFGSVHSQCEDLPAKVARIAEAGLLGIKLHPIYQEFAADDRRMWPCYRAIAEHGLILDMHAGGDISFPPEDDRADPRRILALHRNFPDIPLIANHMGGWKRWDVVAETLAGTEVYLETSFSFDFASPEEMKVILDRHSPERILFGSDSPWREQKETAEIVGRAFPDADVRRKVMSENAERLLREAAERVR